MRSSSVKNFDRDRSKNNFSFFSNWYFLGVIKEIKDDVHEKYKSLFEEILNDKVNKKIDYETRKTEALLSKYETWKIKEAFL